MHRLHFFLPPGYHHSNGHDARRRIITSLRKSSVLHAWVTLLSSLFTHHHHPPSITVLFAPVPHKSPPAVGESCLSTNCPYIYFPLFLREPKKKQKPWSLYLPFKATWRFLSAPSLLGSCGGGRGRGNNRREGEWWWIEKEWGGESRDKGDVGKQIVSEWKCVGKVRWGGQAMKLLQHRRHHCANCFLQGLGYSPPLSAPTHPTPNLQLSNPRPHSPHPMSVSFPLFFQVCCTRGGKDRIYHLSAFGSPELRDAGQHKIIIHRHEITKPPGDPTTKLFHFFSLRSPPSPKIKKDGGCLVVRWGGDRWEVGGW